jgi:outer membrane receptor protein involved in Fe transport
MQRVKALATSVATGRLIGVFACVSCLPALGQIPVQAPPVEVISTTPLPGLGVPKDSVPANVQTGTAADLQDTDVKTVGDFMDRKLDSVNVNQAQGNTYQPDVNFRGLTASPLLGTQPGLSVFQDGVRVNEPFGDTVNWDLIPKSAISDMTLIPGSNPVFGLNTLGGSLAGTTKSGFDNPGLAAEVYGGSFGRAAGDFEYGGAKDRIGYFLTGNLFDESGWREQTNSRVRQGFGKLSYREADTSVDLSFTGADNVLNGAQAIPVSFLEQQRSSLYTFPDTFKNQLSFLNLVGKHYLSDRNLLQGNAYYRDFRSKNSSTNINDNFDPTQPVARGNTQGLNVEDDVSTQGYGFALQYTYLGDIGTLKNRLTLGASLDAGRTDFTESTQEANFADDRSNIPVGDFSVNTHARTTNSYYALYLVDTLTPTPRLDVTLAGRYNWAQVKIEDLTGTNPALNGNSTFSRFNPAAGLTYKVADTLTAYGSYNEGMRIPTPVELTCADPAAPCALPNAFLADPILKPVIAKTFEAGVRGQIAPSLNWHVTAYQTTLQDNILFISASAGSPNTGFFQNVGTARNQGVELGLSGSAGRLTFGVGYSYINAQFRTAFTEQSPNNATADANGDIQVSPGDRIPSIPQNILKLRLGYSIRADLSVGAGMYAASGQFARGNENNQDPSGKVPGYAVFNLDARWTFAPGWQLFGEINNLFNTKYETFGVLGSNFFNGPGNTFDATATTKELFLSPAAPFGAWIGVRYTPRARNL